MKQTQRTTNDRIRQNTGTAFTLFLLLWVTSCASSVDKQALRKFSRVGESVTVPYAKEAVSNSIVLWTRSLTNGYVLYDDAETRLKHVSLTHEAALLFMLRSWTYDIGFWGTSACLPGKSSYWADMIIRILPATNGTQVAVAIQGAHFVRGLAWNIHTLGFEREKAVDLPPCPQDERQVLNEIQSTLRKVGEKPQ